MQENYRSFTVDLHDFSNEELAELFQRTQNEDYLKELMIRNKGVICLIVRGYHITGYDIEDLIEIGNIELWKATQSFDSSKGYTFSNWVKVYLKQALNRLYNEANRLKRGKGAEPTSYEELAEISKERATEDDYSNLYLEDFLGTLSDTTLKVAKLLLDGFTNGEIAKALGFAPATVSYHSKRIGKAYAAYSGVM